MNRVSPIIFVAIAKGLLRRQSEWYGVRDEVMYVCFVLSDRMREHSLKSTERVAGERYALDLMCSPDEGPWYPHIAQEKRAQTYHFFAGRLAGVAPSDKLPSGHAVSSANAESWDFEDGEPEGSWLGLKFDRKRDLVSIASDLFLLQRWYYTCQEGIWYLSNSMLYLHRVLKGWLEIEEKAIPYMLKFGYLPLQFTPLKEVFGLHSGRVLAIERGKHHLAVRARIPVHGRSQACTENLSEKITRVIREAVAEELKNVDSILLSLSGGIDSRFLLGFALEILPREHITTITYGHPRSLDFSIGIGLAKKLGVKHIALPMDTRPIGEILYENFVNSEGMYWTCPDYPVEPFRHALPKHTYVLSGYLGDPVFGCFDLPKEKLCSPVGRDDEHLVELVNEIAVHESGTTTAEVHSVLRPGLYDFRQFETELLDLPGLDLKEKYDRWLYEGSKLNRVNFANELHRDRAFYLAPFVHRCVLDVAYSLPACERRGEKAYFAALKERFPELYAYPTKSNFGFPLGTPIYPRIFAARVWRKAWSEIDKAIGRPLGVILYHHPRTNYAHPRELYKSIHRPYVLDCFEGLKKLEVFSPAGLDVLKNRYLCRKAVNSYLLRGLLTIHQWTKHYGKPA